MSARTSSISPQQIPQQPWHAPNLKVACASFPQATHALPQCPQLVLPARLIGTEMLLHRLKGRKDRPLCVVALAGLIWVASVGRHSQRAQASPFSYLSPRCQCHMHCVWFCTGLPRHSKNQLMCTFQNPARLSRDVCDACLWLYGG